MKHSIKKIFQSLNFYLFSILMIAIIGVLAIFEHTLSFNKVDNLVNQKKIISSLTKLDKNDLELALILFNGKSTHLHQEIDKLHTLYKYAYMDKYIVGNKKEYLLDLNTLKQLTDEFTKAAQEYYTDTNDKNLELKAKKQLDTAFIKINKQINSMLLKNIHYNEVKFKYIKYAVIIIFVLVLFATFYYRKTLKAIYKDIDFLSQTDKNKKEYSLFSQEADAIALRMNRTNITNNSSDMIDPVTEINNYKGMISEYSTKKRKQTSNFTSITVLEIDNFSKSNRVFAQNTIQAILKKVAYTISLFKQPVDIIARTDYNQFTLILSRSSKEQSYKDIEAIRESIAELKFNIPNYKNTTQITVSGGLFIKPNNTSLEEAIKQAKEILLYAQSLGSNKIMQARDLVQKGM